MLEFMGVPIISILLFGLAALIAYFFVVGFVWGAGYFPTPKKEIENAGGLLNPREGDLIYDLGCGFGKVVIQLAQKYPGVKFIGVDIDPIKAWWGSLSVKRKNLGDRVKIVRGNLLDVELSQASGAFIFLSEDTPIMERLQSKMFSEMKPGSRVVSYTHRFKEWEPSLRRGGVYLYVVPSIEGRGKKSG